MKILKIIFSIWLAIIGIILVLSVTAGIYFYYFHVFKTVRVCITNELQDLNAYCESDEDCVSYIMSNVTITKEDYPEFLSSSIRRIIEKSVYCEETCKQRRVYSNIFRENNDEIESCKEGEGEVKVELHGKEIWQLLKLSNQ